VVADNKIYIASEEGVIVVLAAGDRLNVLARNKLDDGVLATPAIVDGRIYFRTASRMYAFATPTGR
jgi:outer membrane protein assembly factor BamB